MTNCVPESSVKGKRHGGLDALRALAAFFVIIIHAIFLPANSGETAKICAAIIFTLISAAVPLFAMISGAFILNRDKNSNAWSFYWHSIKKLFPITALFFLVYFCLYTDYPGQFVRGTESLASIVKHFIEWYGNGAVTPMWYICMLPGLYLLAPLLVVVRRKTSLGVQALLCGVFMVLYFCQYGFHLWHLACPFNAVFWIGYFLLGMILMNLAVVGRLPSLRCSVWVGLCLFAILVFGTYAFIATRESVYPQIVTFLAPVGFIMACSLFVIFAQLKDIRISWLVSKFADLSFLIYLTHAQVLRMLRSVLYHLDLISQLHHDYAVTILFVVSCVILTFLLSWVIDTSYKRVCAALRA